MLNDMWPRYKYKLNSKGFVLLNLEYFCKEASGTCTVVQQMFKHEIAILAHAVDLLLVLKISVNKPEHFAYKLK